MAIAFSGCRPGLCQEHIEVLDVRFTLEKEVVVGWVISRSLVLVARERLDRVERIPECKDLKVGDRAIGVQALEHVDPPIPWRRGVIRNSGLEKILVVGLCLGRGNAPTPYPSDHANLNAIRDLLRPDVSAIDLRAASRCSVVSAKYTSISEIHSGASALLRCQNRGLAVRKTLHEFEHSPEMVLRG